MEAVDVNSKQEQGMVRRQVGSEEMIAWGEAVARWCHGQVCFLCRLLVQIVGVTGKLEE